jgi:hypothetical protein
MSAPHAPHVIAAIDEVLRNGGGTEEIIATLMKLGGTAALFEDVGT